ncbi:paraquat-inducible protein A [Paracoccaceae bacterium GXU_MW_L88]
MTPLRIANLALLVLFPIAWAAPLLRAGLVVPWGGAKVALPFFDQQEVSVLSGIAALWESAPFLSVIVLLFAVIAPLAKIVAVEMMFRGRGPLWLKPATVFLAKLAMADIFLMAIYIVLAKGIALTSVTPGWGLYLFTACVLTSLALSFALKPKAVEAV